tara:strand:- start:144 stop:542 length:399 start_codon:yes stop_codon:yes gene_type:complete
MKMDIKFISRVEVWTSDLKPEARIALNDNTSDLRGECHRLLEHCESIRYEYHDEIGNEYHDEMKMQLDGLNASMADYEDEDVKQQMKAKYCVPEFRADWTAMLKEAQATHKWFVHIGKIIELQTTTPPTIYG